MFGQTHVKGQGTVGRKTPEGTVKPDAGWRGESQLPQEDGPARPYPAPGLAGRCRDGQARAASER
jgi:hypothetical protein